MANSIVKLTTGYYPDPDKGRPLWNAKIYIGVPDLDPRIAVNQLTVTGRQEDGTEVALPQPIRTSSGGVPVDSSGAVVTLLVDGAYSMAVDDNQDSQKYYFANVLDGAPVTFSDKPALYRDTVIQAAADDGLTIGQFVNTMGYNSVSDGGGAEYVVVAGGTGTNDGGLFHNMSNGNQLQLLIEGTANVRQFGVIGDGVADDSSAMQAAGDTGRYTFVDASYTYLLNTSVTGLFYSVGTPTTTGAGTITIKDVTKEGLTEEVLMSADSPRTVIQYGTTTSVKIREVNFVMGGFRFHGKYKNTLAKAFYASSYNSSIDVNTDLPFGMTFTVLENWYGVFACANDGDSNVTFRAVPFLRVKSNLGGNEFRLTTAGEGTTAAEIADPSTMPDQNYSWPNGGVDGAELLVITETVDGRDNAFSGRVTTVTASTSSSLTLDDAGAVGPLDWLLPAPNTEFSHYRYCGPFYIDTAEVRNIADTGTLVKSRGTTDLTGTNTGEVSTSEKREPSGNISPLATAVYFQSTGVLSTTVKGQYVEVYSIDNIHDVSKFDLDKQNASSQSFNSGETTVPFLFGPQYYYKNLGALASSRANGAQNLWGWIEP